MNPSVDLEPAVRLLFGYCKQNNWAGFDPYDALNSPLFARSPVSRSRLCRIAATQALKRLPINIRPILGVSREQNPKGIALFLMALLKLTQLGTVQENRDVENMLERLIALRSPGVGYWCWGYNFPWQSRKLLVPRGAPNIVCTTFVAHALLDLYEARDDSRCIDMASSAADYILDQLYWSTSASSAGFSYPVPGERTQVHNANFLAAAFLCRLYSLTGQMKWLDPAMTAARCSAAAQAADGSWPYGEAATQRWIDNFHTGYNLCALRSIARYAETAEFDTHIRAGFEFYLEHFFDNSGVAKYFHNQKYPIDAHCVAQSIITLLALHDLAPSSVTVAESVCKWAMAHLWDSRGYFYYQVLPLGTNRVPYMRWSQAWMLLGLTTLLEHRYKIALGREHSALALSAVRSGPAA